MLKLDLQAEFDYNHNIGNSTIGQKDPNQTKGKPLRKEEEEQQQK